MKRDVQGGAFSEDESMKKDVLGHQRSRTQSFGERKNKPLSRISEGFGESLRTEKSSNNCRIELHYSMEKLGRHNINP